MKRLLKDLVITNTKKVGTWAFVNSPAWPKIKNNKMKKNKKSLFFAVGLLVILTGYMAQAQKVETSYSSDAYEGPFSGKVLLYISKEIQIPKANDFGGPSFCCFAITVNEIKPGAKVIFDDAATAYPVKLSEIERGEYYAQVVWDRNTGGRSIGNSPGNMYSEPVKINFAKNTRELFSISCRSKIPQTAFEETKYVKELKAPSALLSSFYNRATTIDAAVILPDEYYKDSSRLFPVFFSISGFGGDYHGYSGYDIKSEPFDTVVGITVFLDGNCPAGHSTYANGANSGPWGDAFVKELIPALEKKFRCNGARFLFGHSSGGWSSLWLQINYPETFSGCWASSPDPVDFRNLLRVNIYEDKNMYYDNYSLLRAEALVGGGIPWLYLKDAYRKEQVIYRGEQCMSWNAVFGKKQKNGMAELICDMNTGKIDSVVASHWKDYDISLLLRNHWKDLQPRIDGKVRITAGTSDNFALDKSAKMLEEEMKKLNSKFEFAYYPGDHFTVWTPEYEKEGCHFLATKYMEWLGQHSAAKK